MTFMQPVVLLTLALGLAACGRSDPEALVASGRQYLEKGDYNGAMIQIKNALQSQPGNSAARYLLGLALLESGDAVAAEIELNKALESGYQADDAQVALAKAMLRKGESAKVLASFSSKEISTPSAKAELGAVVGMAQLAQNRHKEATDSFANAISIDPGSITAQLGVARIAAADRDFETALSWVDKVLAASPGNTEAHGLKAGVLTAQGKAEAAESEFRAAVQFGGKQVPPRIALIAHLLRAKSYDKAQASIEELEKIAPKDLRTTMLKAELAFEQRRFPQARDASLQVLKVLPEHIPTLLIAGISSLNTGAYPEAEGYLRKVVNQAPNAVEPKRLLALVRLRMGQTELALNDVRELLKTSGKDAKVLMLAGEAHLASGAVAAAARYYEQAKQIAPDSAALRTRLAQARLASGDVASAIQELSATSASHPDEYEADLALIAVYLRQRQMDRALEALNTLEKKQPNNPLTHNMRGATLLLKRDFQTARASFERALQLNPTYMPAVANLVRLDLQDKNTDAAKKRYQAVLQKEPNNEQALAGMAVLLRLSGANGQDIEKLLRQAVSGHPQSPGARTNLVNFFLRAHDYKAALMAAQEARAALPNDPSMTEMLGMTQLMAKETRQAISSFQRLTELLPKSPQPFVRLATAYVAAKQPDEAIRSLRSALDLRPDLAVVQRDIAAIYASSGRIEEALREARSMQSKHPKQPFGHMIEAEIYAGQKNLARAEAIYREALKKFDAPLLVARAHAIMEAAGKVREADAMAESWIKAHPKDTSVVAYFAGRDITAKRFESAAARYRTALKVSPNNAQFLNNLAWAASQIKEPEALKYAERAHEIEPENPAIMDTLGMILAQDGENERALQLLARATELAPNAHQYRLNFAKTLVNAGRKGAARKELEMLAKLDSRLPIQQEATSLLSGL